MGAMRKVLAGLVSAGFILGGIFIWQNSPKRSAFINLEDSVRQLEKDFQSGHRPQASLGGHAFVSGRRPNELTRAELTLPFFHTFSYKEAAALKKYANSC